jgi:hypothetical protein
VSDPVKTIAPERSSRPVRVRATPVPPLPPLSPPSKPTATESSGIVTIGWTAVSGAISYRVSRSPTGATSWNDITTTTSLSVTNSPGVGSWVYGVVAIASDGRVSARSTPSDPVTISDPNPPGDPGGGPGDGGNPLDVSVSPINATTAQVAWTPAVPVQIEIRRTGTTTWEDLGTWAGTALSDGSRSVYVTELVSGRQYDFRITG